MTSLSSPQPFPLATAQAPLIAARVTLAADAAPGLLPRILEPFAKRDLTPDRLTAWREEDALRVEIRLRAVDEDTLDRILGNLLQIVGMRSLRDDRRDAHELAA